MANGVTTLELQVGVQQQLLDSVVRGVYARQLTICPATAESLLLLADYLQARSCRSKAQSPLLVHS